MGVGGLQGYGEAGFVAGGGDDGSSRDGGVWWKGKGEGRAVSARSCGDEVPEGYGFVVVGGGPAIGYLASVGCGRRGLMIQEEEVSREEVVLGAPGLEGFGGERGLVGLGDLALTPLDEGELDDGGGKFWRGGADGFKGVPGLLELLRGLVL